MCDSYDVVLYGVIEPISNKDDFITTPTTPAHASPRCEPTVNNAKSLNRRMALLVWSWGTVPRHFRSRLSRIFPVEPNSPQAMPNNRKIPNRDLFGLISKCKLPPRLVESDRTERAILVRKLEQHFPISSIPKDSLAVVTSGNQQTAVWAKSCPSHPCSGERRLQSYLAADKAALDLWLADIWREMSEKTEIYECGNIRTDRKRLQAIP
jgi:hypothetical protein